MLTFMHVTKMVRVYVIDQMHKWIFLRIQKQDDSVWFAVITAVLVSAFKKAVLPTEHQSIKNDISHSLMGV